MISLCAHFNFAYSHTSICNFDTPPKAESRSKIELSLANLADKKLTVAAIFLPNFGYRVGAITAKRKNKRTNSSELKERKC